VTSLQAIVENVRAAGIVVAVSAGNANGNYYDCGTEDTPPGLHEASFTVGATDNSDTIAYFSKRGPVTADGSQRPKPDVSAPGVAVRSSLPGGGYGYKQGTSMAVPHVAGLVALLWSAAPFMIGNVDVTENIIRETAYPVVDASCGVDADGHPNNVYGWGIVDALGAVQQPRLAVSAQVEPVLVVAGKELTFTFSITNGSPLTTLTDVALTDTLPASTTFASATGVYSKTDDLIRWTFDPLAPGTVLSATLVVTVEAATPRGTSIINAHYGVRSSQTPTPALGAPAMAWVSWRLFVPLVLKSWP